MCRVRGERDTDTYGAADAPDVLPPRRGDPRADRPPGVDGEGDPGFFGLALTVADLDATGALLGEHLGDQKDAVQDGRRIATLRHKELGMSVATALMSPEPRGEAG